MFARICRKRFAHDVREHARGSSGGEGGREMMDALRQFNLIVLIAM
jgi:hypothetical protein